MRIPGIYSIDVYITKMGFCSCYAPGRVGTGVAVLEVGPDPRFRRQEPPSRRSGAALLKHSGLSKVFSTDLRTIKPV